MYFSDDNVNKEFCKKGETLFADGDAGDALYIVETGAMGIFKMMAGENVCIAVMKPGQMFGEMALIDGSPRMADARAVEDSVVICLPETRLRQQINQSDPFVRAMVKILVDNMRDVHRMFMKKPRSVKDAINTSIHHLDGIREFIKKSDNPELVNAGTAKLDQLCNDIDDLNGFLESHVDTRDCALGENDLIRNIMPVNHPGRKQS